HRDHQADQHRKQRRLHVLGLTDLAHDPHQACGDHQRGGQRDDRQLIPQPVEQQPHGSTADHAEGQLHSDDQPLLGRRVLGLLVLVGDLVDVLLAAAQQLGLFVLDRCEVVRLLVGVVIVLVRPVVDVIVLGVVVLSVAVVVVVVVVVVIVDVVVEFFVLDVVELVAVGVVVVGQRVVFVLVDGLELLGRLGLLHRPARRRRERRLTAGPLLRRLARPRWGRSVRAVEPVVDRTGRRDGRKPGRGLLPDRRAVALTGRRRGREALAGALARRNRGEAGAGLGPGRGREILADAFARCRREGSTGALTGRRRGR